MFYFDSLPKIYSPDENGNPILLTNILTRAKLLEALQNNPMLFYEYSIQDGDTPEIIADKYYNNSFLYWIILYSNQLLDPIWDWPMTYLQFLEYINSKYASEAQEAGKTPLEYVNDTIYDYQKITTTTDSYSDTITPLYSSLTLTQYNSLSPSNETYTFSNGLKVVVDINKRAVTLYDYEYEKNESRRQIKIMNELYASSMSSQLEALM